MWNTLVAYFKENAIFKIIINIIVVFILLLLLIILISQSLNSETNFNFVLARSDYYVNAQT